MNLGKPFVKSGSQLGFHQPGFNGVASKFLFLLICGDIFYFILHIAFLNGLLGRPFSVEADKSLPESYQYLKFLWSLILLVFVAKKEKSFLILPWIPLFAFLLADDGLRIHEQIGNFVSISLHEVRPPLGLRRQDIGELLSSIAIGLPLLLMPALS